MSIELWELHKLLELCTTLFTVYTSSPTRVELQQASSHNEGIIRLIGDCYHSTITACPIGHQQTTKNTVSVMAVFMTLACIFCCDWDCDEELLGWVDVDDAGC